MPQNFLKREKKNIKQNIVCILNTKWPKAKQMEHSITFITTLAIFWCQYAANVFVQLRQYAGVFLQFLENKRDNISIIACLRLVFRCLVIETGIRQSLGISKMTTVLCSMWKSTTRAQFMCKAMHVF